MPRRWSRGRCSARRPRPGWRSRRVGDSPRPSGPMPPSPARWPLSGAHSADRLLNRLVWLMAASVRSTGCRRGCHRGCRGGCSRRNSWDFSPHRRQEVVAEVVVAVVTAPTSPSATGATQPPGPARPDPPSGGHTCRIAGRRDPGQGRRPTGCEERSASEHRSTLDAEAGVWLTGRCRAPATGGSTMATSSTARAAERHWMASA